MYARNGDDESAIRVLREHLKEHPDAVRARQLLIRVLASSGNLRGAEHEAGALAELVGEDDPRPWLELGHAYELNHRYEEALLLYDKAASVAPKDATGPRTGGLRAARWGEAELAEPRLVEATRRDPKDGRTWHALGLVRIRLRDLEGAEHAYRSGLKADPRALENRLGLATVAVIRDDPKRALAHYDALIAARPKHADAHLGRSWALLRLGRLDDADAAITRALQLGADRDAAEAQVRALLRARKGGRPDPRSRAPEARPIDAEPGPARTPPARQ